METVPGFRSRCEHLINTLPIPCPFDARIFLANLAQWRGRRIELVPATLPATLPCGMLVSTDDVDYIFHPIDTTLLHAQHIDMHEVGHLLLEHAASPDSRDTEDGPTLAEQNAVRLLLPDLSPELIRRILGRTVYSDAHEREAELFASMLLSRTSSSAVPTAGASDFVEHLSQLRLPAAHPRAGARCAA